MEPRFNKVVGIFGRRGSGKTDYLKGNPVHNIPGLMNKYPARDMKVLIVDTIDHPSYREIPRITPEKLPYWKRGIYRLYDKKTVMPEMIEAISNHVWNTLIVFEDAYKHQKKTLDSNVVDLILDSKQKNLDIIFMYHAWILAPNDLYRLLDSIEVFKTKDTPEARKEQMAGYYEDAIQVHNEVMKHESSFYHKSLNTEL